MPNTREKLIDLLKRSFEIFVKKLWLKEIDRAIDRHKKAQSKANRDFFVMQALVNRYNEIYNENLWEKDNGHKRKVD